MKYIRLGTRITPEQNQILFSKAKASGYTTVSNYVRSILFRSISSEDKINAIYKRICKE